LLCRTVTQELKFKQLEALKYRLTILHPLGQVDKRYGQIVSSPYSYWGGGGPQKGWGGFPGLNTKDTNSQSFPTILYTSQGFLINFQMDAMNILRKRISGDTGTILRRTYKLKNNSHWNAWNAFMKFH